MSPTILLPLHLLCDATDGVIVTEVCKPTALTDTNSEENLTTEELFGRRVLAHSEIPLPRLQTVVTEKRLLSVPLLIELKLESETVACELRRRSYVSVKPD